MTPIQRIYQYLAHFRISSHAFERKCELGNGYLNKQARGRGTIGSEILERIIERYPDLSLNWLVTGRGDMLNRNYEENTAPVSHHVEEEERQYPNEAIFKMMQDKITLLEQSLTDKDKIIRMLESRPPGEKP